MQSKKTKAKIEGIHPLGFFQQALLFHSLQEEEDQGFLHVRGFFEGSLDVAGFKEAWGKTIRRHEALRTSIHWKDIERPVQVIHEKADLPFVFEDWSELADAEQDRKISQLKIEDGKKKLDLTAVPVLRITLAKLRENRYFFLWSCHHILMDGWSASIILQDLLEFYAVGAEDAGLKPVPTLKSYQDFVKKQDLSKAELFWQQHFEGFEKPSLVGQERRPKTASGSQYKSELLILSAEESDKFRHLAKKTRVTSNTLVHGLWAVLLGRYLNKRDIVFGQTVSGRSVELPNAELMAGMFMNVLPLRIVLNPSANFSDWLAALQKLLAAIRNYESVSLDKILGWMDLPGNYSMFDSLVVFENIPFNALRNRKELSVSGFRSGLTTTYPLTLAVRPVEQIEFVVKYDSSLFSKEQIGWWADNLALLTKAVIADPDQTLGDLSGKMSLPVISVSTKKPPAMDKNTGATEYAFPRSKTELDLTRIWEDLFDRQPIGINDNFFELGGRSILAVRMFARIEKEFGRNLPPTALLENPSIAGLARLIRGERETENWSSLVPIRAKGSKPPVFCMHAGGAHVLYYKTLSDHLDADQPVYGIQPIGLDGRVAPQESVEEMARHYLAEIKKVWPAGPVYFVGYCFSNAVCVEMARQLKEAGESDFKIIIIDSHPMYMPHDETLMPNFWERLQSYRHLVRERNWREIYQRSSYKLRTAKRRISKFFTKNGAAADSSPRASGDDGRQVRSLQEIQDALQQAYENYEWQPFDGRISLVLAGSWETHPWARVIIEQWKLLAGRGVEYFFVPGSHETLFEEPDVRGLAAGVQKYLDEGTDQYVADFSD